MLLEVLVLFMVFVIELALALMFVLEFASLHGTRFVFNVVLLSMLITLSVFSALL